MGLGGRYGYDYLNIVLAYVCTYNSVIKIPYQRASVWLNFVSIVSVLYPFHISSITHHYCYQCISEGQYIDSELIFENFVQYRKYQNLDPFVINCLYILEWFKSLISFSCSLIPFSCLLIPFYVYLDPYKLASILIG